MADKNIDAIKRRIEKVAFAMGDMIYGDIPDFQNILNT